jgi:hypothetical protein
MVVVVSLYSELMPFSSTTPTPLPAVAGDKSSFMVEYSLVVSGNSRRFYGNLELPGLPRKQGQDEQSVIKPNILGESAMEPSPNSLSGLEAFDRSGSPLYTPLHVQSTAVGVLSRSSPLLVRIKSPLN